MEHRQQSSKPAIEAHCIWCFLLSRLVLLFLFDIEKRLPDLPPCLLVQAWALTTCGVLLFAVCGPTDSLETIHHRLAKKLAFMQCENGVPVYTMSVTVWGILRSSDTYWFETFGFHETALFPRVMVCL